MSYTVEKQTVTPYFSLEDFMVMSQEKRLGGAALERLAKLWEAWMADLNVYVLATGKIKYLAVWLPESVEEGVDATWERSPSDGYLENTLAQFMCMSAVREMLPEVEDSGCAPAPRPTETLRAAMESLGVPYREAESVLSRRYASVTHYPFRGGCEICHLHEQCPKGQGRSEGGSVLLPGYEQGVDQ